jgi:hypothetical protein
MPLSEKKHRLLKARIALALHEELGRVPTAKEINQVFLLARVIYKAILALDYGQQNQKSGELSVFPKGRG